MTDAVRRKTPLKMHLGSIGLIAGVAIGVGAVLWRRQMTSEMPAYIWSVPAALGAMGQLIRSAAVGLFQGKSFTDAVGADETTKTSPVVIGLAAALFVPLWAGSVAMLISSMAPSATVERLVAWSVIALFLTALVAGLVREFRKPGSPKR